jgi:uncharacterized protein (DUF3820 family)
MSEERKQSYTEQLKTFLEGKKCPQAYLDLISEFSLDYVEKRKQEQEKTKGIINFGKYKGKKLQDIYKLDKTYIMWLQKNNKYLNQVNKEIVEELLK